MRHRPYLWRVLNSNSQRAQVWPQWLNGALQNRIANDTNVNRPDAQRFGRFVVGRRFSRLCKTVATWADVGVTARSTNHTAFPSSLANSTSAVTPTEFLQPLSGSTNTVSQREMCSRSNTSQYDQSVGNPWATSGCPRTIAEKMLRPERSNRAVARQASWYHCSRIMACRWE